MKSKAYVFIIYIYIIEKYGKFIVKTQNIWQKKYWLWFKCTFEIISKVSLHHKTFKLFMSLKQLPQALKTPK